MKKRNSSQRARWARSKGHGFERDIANWFKELGWPKARRHLEYQDGEAFGVDIANVEPFKVQCKNHKDYCSISTIHEIQPTDGIKLLITKGLNKEPMVVIPLEQFKSLVKLYRLWEDL